MPYTGTPFCLDAAQLARNATALREDARAGTLRPLLRGRHIALLCDDPHCASAQRLLDAAAPLGAHVSRLSGDVTGADSDHALRLLARLYDVIDCEHAPAQAAARLREAVPERVFEGLASPEHALVRGAAALMHEGGAAAPDDDDLRSIVQALLVHAVG